MTDLMSPTDLFRVQGKVCVVTGGTRGIGLEMAKALTANGATVVVSSRKEPAVGAAVETLEKLGKASGIAADLGTENGIKALADHVATHHDQVDVLINNAGATWGAPLSTFPKDGWDKVMDLNVTSPFFLTQALLPLMENAAKNDGPAKIINVSSVEGMRPGPLETYSYGVSKAGLLHLTKHLALQLAGKNITVNALAPGPFATKMMKGTIDTVGEEAIAGMVPLKRIGKDSDLHAAALFLSSQASDFMTGSTIPLGGGLGPVA